MKICMLAEYSPYLDEGVKNIGINLAKRLSKNHEVAIFSPREILSPKFWKSIKELNPQIIHYIPGSTLTSFIIAKIVALQCRGVRTIITVIHPLFSSVSKKFVPLFKPNLVLIQSYETEKAFSSLGCKVAFLPSGVDLEKFVPVSEKTKQAFREKYGLDKGKFTILHVGHILEKRNLQVFKKIQSYGNQIIIVGSPSTRKPEEQIYHDLKENGCFVWNTYFENIEEIYALSDCYIFPAIEVTGSIEMPLSVMEAMACNLPVISTKFGALPRAFEEGDGLIFVEGENELVDKLEGIKDLRAKTREKVMPYSWEKVTQQLEEIYHKIIS